MTPNRVTVALEKYSKYVHPSNHAALTVAAQNASNSCTLEFMTLPVKSPVITVLLSIFLGGLGLDRFYIGDKKLGIAKILARIISIQLASVAVIGSLLSLAVSVWLIADIFITFKMCREMNFNMLYSYLNKHPAPRNTNNANKPKNNLNNAMSGVDSGSMPSRGRLSDFAEELAVGNRDLSEEGKEEVFGAPVDDNAPVSDEGEPHTTGYNSLNDMDEDEESGTPLATNTNRDDGRRAGEDSSSGRSTSNPFSL